MTAELGPFLPRAMIPKISADAPIAFSTMTLRGLPIKPVIAKKAKDPG